jgi:uncharacterized protein YjiS (DUF1127 family)
LYQDTPVQTALISDELESTEFLFWYLLEKKMAKLINMIIAVILDRRIAAERKRAYREAIRELEAYTDDELIDLGIARHDIPHVVKHGYTDRSFDNDVPACEYEQAVHELESYSDHDLDDLGLARRDIVKAVKCGRKGELYKGDFPVTDCAGAL